MENPVKVRVEMDDGWSWSLDKEGETRYDRTVSMEVSDALIAEYEALLPKWVALQDKLEQLYRSQEGLKPYEWTVSPTPDHKLLEKSHGKKASNDKAD